MGERPSSSSGPTRLRSATKCFLFSINLVTFIFGLVLFFLGVVLQTRYARYFFASEDDAPVVGVGAADGGDEEGHSSPSSPSSSSPFYNLSAWCTAMGVVVCVVSFLGELSLPHKKKQQLTGYQSCNYFLYVPPSTTRYFLPSFLSDITLFLFLWVDVAAIKSLPSPNAFCVCYTLL